MTRKGRRKLRLLLLLLQPMHNQFGSRASARCAVHRSSPLLGATDEEEDLRPRRSAPRPKGCRERANEPPLYSISQCLLHFPLYNPHSASALSMSAAASLANSPPSSLAALTCRLTLSRCRRSATPHFTATTCLNTLSPTRADHRSTRPASACYCRMISRRCAAPTSALHPVASSAPCWNWREVINSSLCPRTCQLAWIIALRPTQPRKLHTRSTPSSSPGPSECSRSSC